MPTLLIKNGTLVSSTEVKKADILLKDGKIFKIEPTISEADADKIIDATAKLIFPGGIDPHVHLDLPTPAGKSYDSFETGSRAALLGGTTTLLDFVTPHKNQSLIEALHLRQEEAKNCYTDYSFHVSPVNWNENTAEELKQCTEIEGITSFKFYMAYDIGLSDFEIAKVMQTVSELGGLVTVHAENGGIINHLREKFVQEGKIQPKYHALSRPEITEEEAINRVISIAKITNCRLYIVHVSSGKGIELISKAQKEGVQVLAETCPHYLLLDDSVYNQEFEKSAPYVLSPPLRTKNDQNALWEAIQSHSIQTIGTDHCPFNLHGQKDIGISDFTKIPNGAGGIEHRMSLLFTYGVLENRISLMRFVELTSTNAAKIFGLSQKGDLIQGYDADLVIWNPLVEKSISVKTHYQNCDSDIYEGFKTKGVAETVILRGEIVVENENFISAKAGKFLKRTR